ncbi:MAG: T9SS type A sorting domain-containing protein [Bacteroidia bacterium]|nr:T9SS type A sorting domain-containing protein [Bacteroidia bacterium]
MNQSPIKLDQPVKTPLLTTLLIILLQTVSAQTVHFFVTPQATNPAFTAAQDSHAIGYLNGTPQQKLFVFIGGTGSSSSQDYGALIDYVTGLGYHTINLSYPNNVAAASMAGDSDSLIFDHYRQELCYGTPVSADVTVDSLNSIYSRLLNLLQYLKLNNSSQGWSQYLTSGGQPEWSKIVVAGHSQGSGHAAYLAKYHPMERVLMFSGPNDYSDFYSNSGHWVRQSGISPVTRYFSYLSLNDEAVDYAKQFVVLAGLGMLQADDSTYVDNQSSPFGYSHCLYTTQAPGFVLLNHNVPVKNSVLNKEVWNYMLSTPIPVSRGEEIKASAFRISPNPTRNLVQVETSKSLGDADWMVMDMHGRMLTRGIVPVSGRFSVDMEKLPAGIYLLKAGRESVRIIRE